MILSECVELSVFCVDQTGRKLTVRWRHALIITSLFSYITVYYYNNNIISYYNILNTHACISPSFLGSRECASLTENSDHKREIIIILLLCKRLSENVHSLARVQECCKTEFAAAFDNGNINLRFATFLFVLLTSVRRRF